MSIIEKAVGKLEKEGGGRRGGEPGGDALAGSAVEAEGTAASAPQNIPAPEAVSEAALHEVEKVELPLDKLAEIGMITPDKPRSQIAEEFRIIKRPLLLNILGEGAAMVDNINLIMVTSALAGEGKTFSAINLAMSIAMEQDKTVLFVDADVSKATAATLLGISSKRPGLIDLLEDPTIQMRDVMLHTNVPNLRILTAGRLHDRATELLASEAMHRLMLDLSRRYPDRVIVFDSPPLLQSTEAVVLANLMGQVVFVVAAEQTGQDAVTEAVHLLKGEKIIGMVLNKSRRRVSARYGYGYGYGYGNYRVEPAEAG